MTFIGKRSGSRYVSFSHPSRLTTQDSGRWQEGRRSAGLGTGSASCLVPLRRPPVAGKGHAGLAVRRCQSWEMDRALRGYPVRSLWALRARTTLPVPCVSVSDIRASQ
jgi:hypothetical protein